MRSPLCSLVLVSPLFLAATLFSAPYDKASALASPSPYPMPFMNADYDSHLASLPHATRRTALERSRLYGGAEHSDSAASKHHPSAPESLSYVNNAHTKATPRSFRRRSELDLSTLTASRNNAMAQSEELQNLASQQTVQDEGDPAFQAKAVEGFSSFKSSMEESKSILAELGSQNGLANYDKNDQLETILKDLVNAIKIALGAVYAMISKDPTLDPILGPIVYDIKCILDEVLDATENITDGLLNALKPLLSPGI